MAIEFITISTTSQKKLHEYVLQKRKKLKLSMVRDNNKNQKHSK